MSTPSFGPMHYLLALYSLGVLVGVVSMWAWAIRRAILGRPLLPDEKPRPRPWGAGSVGCVVLLVVVLDTISAATVEAISGAPPAEAGATAPEPPERNPASLLAVVATRNLVIIALVPLILHATSRATLADLGFSRRGIGRDLRIGLGACMLLAPICYLWMYALTRLTDTQQHPVAEMLRQGLSPATVVLALLSAMVFAPVAEELLFRGVLLGWLGSALRPRSPDEHLLTVEFESVPSLGDVELDDAVPASSKPPPPPRPARETVGSISWLPNLITSVLFAGLHHQQWPAPIPLFVLSLGLGLLAQRTGRLWAPIALHASFNGLGTIALLLGLGTGAMPEPEESARVAPAQATRTAPRQSSTPQALGPEKTRDFGLGGTAAVNYDSLPHFAGYEESCRLSKSANDRRGAARASGR